MTLLFDSTVTGAGDIDGYIPAPLTLYTIITVVGQASTHDYPIGGRFFDVGWFAPYFLNDPAGLGTEHYQFKSTFIEYEFMGISLHEFTGGIDGIHYDLGDGVEVRFVMTDD